MSERYEVKKRLGRGGVGAVYEGYDTQLDRPVAIKRLLPLEETHLNQEDTQSLSREASALAKFQHPNVVTIFGFEEDSDGPFVVTELIKGDNLKAIVEKGAMQVADFQEFVFQSLDAIIAAEQLNLLHRDIKPANIMLLFLPSGRFQVKILDFGLAKFSQTPSTQTLDQKGSFLGSIDYIAPEQIERRPLDQRMDLYAFGCVCYFALTQKPPFEGENVAKTMQNHLSHKVTPILELRPDLPAAIGDWVMRMISARPEDRPASSSIAAAEFENAKLGISPAVIAEDNEDSAPVAIVIEDEKTKTGRMMITGSQPVSIPTKQSRSIPLPSSSVHVKKTAEKSLKGPLIGLCAAVVLGIGFIIFVVNGQNGMGTNPGISAAQNPVESPQDLPNQVPSKTNIMVELGIPPVSSALAVWYSAQTDVFTKDNQPAKTGDEVWKWKNLAPTAGSGKNHRLFFNAQQGQAKPTPPVLKRVTSGKGAPFTEPSIPVISVEGYQQLVSSKDSAFMRQLSESPLTIVMLLRARPVPNVKNGHRLMLFKGAPKNSDSEASPELFYNMTYNVGQFGSLTKVDQRWNYAGVKRGPGGFKTITWQWSPSDGTQVVFNRSPYGSVIEGTRSNEGLRINHSIENYILGTFEELDCHADFAEILIYSALLSNEERTEVENWISDRYFVKP